MPRPRALGSVQTTFCVKCEAGEVWWYSHIAANALNGYGVRANAYSGSSLNPRPSRLDVPRVARIHGAVHEALGLLLQRRVERQGLVERAPESHVGQPAPTGGAGRDEQDEVIELRAEAASLVSHARREEDHLEAEEGQQVCEKPIQLVAETTTSLAHDLAEQRRALEHDGAAEVDVEVLERHRVEVRAVEGAEGVDRRRAPSGVPDAREVGVGVPCVHVGQLRRLAGVGQAEDRRPLCCRTQQTAEN